MTIYWGSYTYFTTTNAILCKEWGKIRCHINSFNNVLYKPLNDIKG